MPAELSLFYHPETFTLQQQVVLNEDTARHATQVLRLREGDALQLTNGNGLLGHAMLHSISKKACTVQITACEYIERPQPKGHLAVAFTRNTARNEWLLEKAIELGIQQITPLKTSRSMRERIKESRWKGIMISAMLQSRQYYLPQLKEACDLDGVLIAAGKEEHTLIAHCIESRDRTPIFTALKEGSDTLILIGPEGDFTDDEVSLATAAGAVSIALGGTRLRTETAAIAACAAFHFKNKNL